MIIDIKHNKTPHKIELQNGVLLLFGFETTLV